MSEQVEKELECRPPRCHARLPLHDSCPVRPAWKFTGQPSTRGDSPVGVVLSRESERDVYLNLRLAVLRREGRALSHSRRVPYSRAPPGSPLLLRVYRETSFRPDSTGPLPHPQVPLLPQRPSPKSITFPQRHARSFHVRPLSLDMNDTLPFPPLVTPSIHPVPVYRVPVDVRTRLPPNSPAK